MKYAMFSYTFYIMTKISKPLSPYKIKITPLLTVIMVKKKFHETYY